MRTLRTKTGSKGFTLIEMSVAIMIIGLMIAPAMYLYGQKLKVEKIEQTKDAMKWAEMSMADYYSMYARYPCPASTIAQPGDANYGREDCSATPVGVVTVMSNTVPAVEIMIGSVPFRQMNLQEQQSYDGYGNRLTYAIPRFLTDSTTFDPEAGAISLVDINDVNMLPVADSARFILASHGADGVGGVTRSGVVRGGCPAGTLQEENCDNDATFRQSDVRVGFDDLIVHSNVKSATMTPWKYSSADMYDVSLSDLDKFGVGTKSALELSSGSGSNLTVLNDASDDAVILASSGALVSNNLCDYNDSGCFSPDLIAGEIASGGGMACPAGQFLTGVENGAPVCATDIRFECPLGQYMTGVDADGAIVCQGAPAPACTDQGVTTACGTSGTITAIYDGGYRTVESGECYTLDTFSSTTAAGQATVSDLQNYIDTLNAGSRSGPSVCSGDNLVRDSYQCDGGTWQHRRTHEKGNYWNSFPSNPNQSSQTAETGGTSYSLTASRTANDCWCREDYRVRLYSCPTGYTGNRVRVQKYRCPQTYNSWQTIYSDNNTFCTCTPTTTTSTQWCSSYYGVSWGSMSGQVTWTYNNTCDASGNLVTDPSPSQTDNCTCEAQPSSPVETTVNCPTGTTNSFSYGGRNYTGVSEVRVNTWTCPNGAGNPVSSAADAGSWSGPVTVHTEACVCDTTLTDTVTEACPAGYSGAGIEYLREWDCVAGDWEPRSDWDKISESCTQCTWKRPSSTGTDGVAGIGNEVGTGGCTCGSSNLCYEGSGTEFTNYSGCSCLP